MFPAQLLVLHAIDSPERNRVHVLRIRVERLVQLNRRRVKHRLQPLTPRTPRRVKIDHRHRMRVVKRLHLFLCRQRFRARVRHSSSRQRFLVLLHHNLRLRQLFLVHVRVSILPWRLLRPRQRPSRSKIPIDWSLKHRLGQIIPRQSQRVPNIHRRELARQSRKRHVKVNP